MEQEEDRIGALRRLSQRELEILQEQCAGKVYAEIAEWLAISTATVQFHASNIYRKLELDGHAKAARQRELGKFCLALEALQTEAVTQTPKILNDMAYVPEGVFLHGSTTEQLIRFARLCGQVGADCEVGYFIDEQPQRQTYLAAFYIDVYEVTNAKFRRFVDATGYRTTAELAGKSLVWSETVRNFHETPGANWRQPRGPATSSNERMNDPVVHVSYEDAQAYCAWARMRLPTEAEWEKAARGPAGWLFPWGNTWNPDAGNYVRVAPDGTTSVRGLTSVGSFPAGVSRLYGIHDLLGNVAEWVADVYDPDYYATAPRHNPLNTTPPASRPTIQHVRRGGSWATMPGYLHASWRIDRPDTTSDTIGFRCARFP